MKLLNPGPVSMTDRVRRALASDDVCHREPEFSALMERVRGRIAAIYGEPGFRPVLLGGSGTSAVEAMLTLVSPAKKALVVANGVYGERMAAMLRAQNKPHEVVASAAWTNAMDLAGVEKALASGTYGHVLAVHHETTTGRLNDIAALGALCKRFDVPMLLDAVSSFAGEEIRMVDWNIEALAATANKCVHGAPGVSFVLAREEALARPGFATSVYLDLVRHANEQKKGSAPFTLPTHVMAAFDEALAELAEEGGWKKRHETYKARSTRVRNVLAELGIHLLLDRDDAYGSTLTSFRLPEGKTYEALHARLKSDGFVIYAGQGKFDGAIFRIAVMGDLSTADIDRLAASLRGALG
ncbi:2-aminoethylphosphonate:pyruvate aminotransferase [Labilithrix luteola]|uniref:2-aminoethylphosphonate--pyruvate transaminase n=1 Tax=Labilithrix luteola TaxID=1391654 RepID=A0A0K1QD87_9BACT|nr:aminotransferase class V-fold PLP-dependent enzyme [Labilithrix luteola]AKV03726.1 2-aminoethylphosphonate:pyruvate aminotransferase [Labilithrix luteola]